MAKQFFVFFLFLCLFAQKITAQDVLKKYKDTCQYHLDNLQYRPKTNFFVGEFSKLKHELFLNGDTILFNKIKYFDMILFNDEYPSIGYTLEKFVLLNENYQLINEINLPFESKKKESIKFVSPFVSGISFVHSEKDFLIDTIGNLIPNSIETQSFVGKNHYFLLKDSLLSMYDLKHKKIKTWKENFSNLESFQWNEKLLLLDVKDKNTKLLIDEKGETKFKNLTTAISEKEKTTSVLIDKKENAFVFDNGRMLAFKFDSSKIEYVRSTYILGTSNGIKGYFHFSSNRFIPFSNQDLRPFYDSIFILEKNGLCSFYDIDEKLLIPHEYKPFSDFNYNCFVKNDSIFKFDEKKIRMIQTGIAAQNWKNRDVLNDKWVIIQNTTNRLYDQKQNTFSTIRIDSVYSILNRKHFTSNNETYIVMNDGNIVKKLFNDSGKIQMKILDSDLVNSISLTYDSINWQSYSFENIKVKKGLKYGVINYKGEEICPVIFDKVSITSNSLLTVKNENKLGVYAIDLHKLIVPIEFDDIIINNDKFILAKKDRQITVFNNFGEIILSPPCQPISFKVKNKNIELLYDLNGKRYSKNLL